MTNNKIEKIKLLEDFLQKLLLEKRVWLNVDILENGTEEIRELIN